MSEPQPATTDPRSPTHLAALRAAAEGDMIEASHLLSDALLEVNAADLLNDLGVSRHALGLDDDAETLFRAALLMDPTSRDASSNLARLVAPRAPRAQEGVLVSFCNGRGPTMGLLHPDTLRFERVDLVGHLPAQGITGLAASGNRVYAVLHNLLDERGWFPTPASGLMVLDGQSLRILTQYRMAMGADVHSIAVLGDTVYAVSTGTDEVLALRMEGDGVVDEQVFWRPDPSLSRDDHHHLNAIIAHEGELLVSGFGRKADVERWSSARDGFIFNITRGRELVRGIYQPHSVTAFDEGLGYCESPLQAARLPAGRSCEELPGYSRGMCEMGSKLFVGTSQGRRRSKSTGVINNVAEGGYIAGHCGVVRLDASGLRPEGGIDLGVHAPEIYDLLAWRAAA